MHRQTRTALGAVAVALLATSAIPSAQANEFVERCIAAGGPYSAPACTCLDTTVASDRERRELVDYFTTLRDIAKGGSPISAAATSVAEHNGVVLTNKYAARCTR